MKPCVLCGNPKQESEEPYCLRCEEMVADAMMDACHESGGMV